MIKAHTKTGLNRKELHQMNKAHVRFTHKIIMLLLILFIICGLPFAAFSMISERIPATICMRENEYKTIDFNLPITANMEISSPVTAKSVKSVNFHEPVSFVSDTPGEYSINIKILGLFNVKTLTVNVLSKSTLIPCGFPVGIYLKTDGILVVNPTSFTNQSGSLVSPCEGLVKPGDYIKSVNGNAVDSKSAFMAMIASCTGEPVILEISRDDSECYVEVLPQKDVEGAYKIGLWVKDDSQGIGTLTYISSDGSFGALGHAISDSDVGEILKIKSGILYNARILSIAKGERGKPGEFIGSINYNESNRIGTILRNKPDGIYGVINDISAVTENYDLTPLEIGFKEDIEKGEAVIQTYLSGKPDTYSIKITEINSDESGNKNITFVVTDPKLISITNGIVQGMSGSPIIQNDRIIGAVTHVFVDDSTCGYGIFIENMLD